MVEFHEATRASRITGGVCEEDASQILLVGEDNPLSTAPEHALYPYPPNCAGHRLQEKIFDVGARTYLHMWRINLCVGGWSAPTARLAANKITEGDVPWSVIVLLGQKVQSVFDQVLGEGAVPENFRHRTWSRPPTRGVSFTLVSLPHPSGRNRIWNNPGVIGDARKLMSEVAPGMSWGEFVGGDGK